MSWATSSLAARAMAIVLALLLASVGAWAQAAPHAVAPQPPASVADGRPLGSDSKRAYEAADPIGGRLFQPTGNPDRDFALMMRAHHQEGVDMAKLEIASGKSTKLKVIARRIVKDQQREIGELDKWTARHNVHLSSDEVSSRRP